jgi:hypothetical protein
MGRSKAWLYKWLDRYDPEDPDWCRDKSRLPRTNPLRTAREIEEIVKLTRLSLYNQGLFCGAQAILWELEEQDVQSLPSLRTINRILRRNELTHQRTGRYKPKGARYPNLPARVPNFRHQADFVGPRHLRGDKAALRFYSMNVVDLGTGRCGTQPVFSRHGNAVFQAFWAIWGRLGMPRHLQVDNETVFYGSPTQPRGMGPLIRLCLHCGVELWFIPPSEPWRNGVVEQFNHHYQQKFLDRVSMRTESELREGALAFEQKHNSRYRYSKLNGKTPLEALAQSGKKVLRFPTDEHAPTTPLKKPKTGKYHLIRFIRSDCMLDIFGEHFRVSPELQYEYVVATIDVKEQKLKLIHDRLQVDEFDYKLR